MKGAKYGTCTIDIVIKEEHIKKFRKEQYLKKSCYYDLDET